MKDWFKARNLWGGMILNLSDAEAGRLCKALWRYTMTGEQSDLSGAEKAIFPMLMMTLRQDEERDQEISSKRSAAGTAGGNQRVANASKAKQIQANASKSKQMQANACNKNKNKNTEQEQEEEKESKEKSSLPLAFDRFWAAYPRHTAKDVARKAFAKLNPSEELLTTILTAIDRQKASSQWQRDGGQYIPHPATWLNQRRWEDEVTPSKPVIKTVPEQQYTQRQYPSKGHQADDWLVALAEASMEAAT